MLTFLTVCFVFLIETFDVNCIKEYSYKYIPMEMETRQKVSKPHTNDDELLLPQQFLMCSAAAKKAVKQLATAGDLACPAALFANLALVQFV